MTTISDAMFVALKAAHPTAGETLGDLLYAENLSPRLGSFEYYNALKPAGTTWSDAAFLYWTDTDSEVSKLQLEDGNDLLLESGGFILMEIGNG